MVEEVGISRALKGNTFTIRIDLNLFDSNNSPTLVDIIRDNIHQCRTVGISYPSYVSIPILMEFPTFQPPSNIQQKAIHQLNPSAYKIQLEMAQS